MSRSPSNRKRTQKSYLRRMVRNQIAGDQNWQCFYCGCDIDMSNATTDHVIPLSKGGENLRSNMVASCKPCNVKKRDRVI
jgi:5-methylcytosine-specific restriction endonuclease McrA